MQHRRLEDPFALSPTRACTHATASRLTSAICHFLCGEKPFTEHVGHDRHGWIAFTRGHQPAKRTAQLNAKSLQLRDEGTRNNLNKEIVRRHLDLINCGDRNAAAEFFANGVRHQGITRGKSVLADNLQDIFTTFPDWRMEIVDMAADGMR
jgi:SnoaL-like polyketide cyclase